jgi:hypothetical protein
MLKETDIQASVLQKIRTGEVSMRPKLFFIAKVAALAVVAALAFASAMLVLSFAFFSIHESGEQFLLGFGQRGFIVFIQLFPWIPFFIAVLLILLLDFLLRYFKFGYRISMLDLFLIALAAAMVVGFFITLTPLHTDLRDRAERGELPIIGEFYEHLQGKDDMK